MIIPEAKDHESTGPNEWKVTVQVLKLRCIS